MQRSIREQEWGRDFGIAQKYYQFKKIKKSSLQKKEEGCSLLQDITYTVKDMAQGMHN